MGAAGAPAGADRRRPAGVGHVRRGHPAGEGRPGRPARAAAARRDGHRRAAQRLRPPGAELRDGARRAAPGRGPFPAVFIRAPQIEAVGPEVEVLARLPQGTIWPPARAGCWPPPSTPSSAPTTASTASSPPWPPEWEAPEASAQERAPAWQSAWAPREEHVYARGPWTCGPPEEHALSRVPPWGRRQGAARPRPRRLRRGRRGAARTASPDEISSSLRGASPPPPRWLLGRRRPRSPRRRARPVALRAELLGRSGPCLAAPWRRPATEAPATKRAPRAARLQTAGGPGAAGEVRALRPPGGCRPAGRARAQACSSRSAKSGGQAGPRA